MSQASRHVMWALIALWTAWAAAAGDQAPKRFPNIVIITVDTLRFDRVSHHGYRRLTSPHIDALLESGVRFTQARVPEPLTAPSMASMLTGLFPHEHGSSRNGLRIRPGLPSLTSILKRRGYRTAAFVGSWTLKDRLTGLGAHFESYNEVFTRKRWFGLLFSEATAEDLTGETLDWIDDHLDAPQVWPFLVWVHYVEPHAPYRFHREFASRLGIDAENASPSDRYDTEVAFVDRAIGQLVAGVKERSRPVDTLILFASDHGESLGEHGYWGHGRNLYEETLRIPMGISWEGRLEPRTIDAPASLLDLAPTSMGLLALTVPTTFRGYDWSRVLRGETEPPQHRVTLFQAHKGAWNGGDMNARRQGLLSVGRIENQRKEIVRVRSDNRLFFDLTRDRAEKDSLAASKTESSTELAAWLQQVREGLAASDELPPPTIDEESVEQLRALGYID